MRRILLIEPDKVLASTYKLALEGSGHKVVAASSAQAAISAADKHQPEVVILEIQLNAHSGIEFLYEFRSYADWQDIPVIILTTVPPGEFNGNWQILKDELGVSNYLYKPHTSLQKLLASLDEVNIRTTSESTSY